MVEVEKEAEECESPKLPAADAESPDVVVVFVVGCRWAADAAAPLCRLRTTLCDSR